MRLINFKNTLASRDYCTRFLRPAVRKYYFHIHVDRAASKSFYLIEQLQTFSILGSIFEYLRYSHTSLCFPARPGNYIKCSLSKDCDYRLAIGGLRISNVSGPPITWFQNQRRMSNFGCDSEVKLVRSLMTKLTRILSLKRPLIRTFNLILTDLLDGYEKIVSAFVIETCKTQTTASALSSWATDVYNLW